jgi:acetolactate synthase I/II/III large subunit
LGNVDPLQSVAAEFLRTLARRGVEHVFTNAGTDTAPIIESMVAMRAAGELVRVPQFITVPHENLAVAMAHGYYRTGGKPPAVMVHVSVGTGNTLNGVMNAARDHIPLLLLAGRTPLTQEGSFASRSSPIHWGQENFDQAAMVREFMKWDFELRAGMPVDQVVGRALDLAMSEPRGPVYLTLPREVLASASNDGAQFPLPAIHAPQPDPAGIEQLAGWVAGARNPLIVTTYVGRDVHAVPQLAALAERFAIPVLQAAARYVNLPDAHPLNLGHRAPDWLRDADLVIVIDAEVPWIPRAGGPSREAKVAHLGFDPLCARYPFRSFPADLLIAGSTRVGLRLLSEALSRRELSPDAVQRRREGVRAHREMQSAAREKILKTASTARPIVPTWLAHCVSEIVDEGTILINELGWNLDGLTLSQPGTYMGINPAGGLGFGLGAAVGAKLAAPDRLIITATGDGSYMFGNPTPFHWVARAAQLPVLTIIANNSSWHAVEVATRGTYPNGQAAAAGDMPLVSLAPSPEYCKVAEACDAFAQRVDDPQELPAALRTAVQRVRGGQQALLDVRMRPGRD